MRHALVLPLAAGLALACSNSTPSGTVDETGASTSESGDEAGELPLECEDPVSVSARQFVVSLGEFPGADEFQIELTLACEVVSVGLEAGMIATALECVGDDGEPHSAGLEVPAPAQGSPAWAAGEAVTLQVRAVSGHGGLADDPTPLYADVQHVALHRDDDGMLLAAGTYAPGIAAQLYAPVQVDVNRDACGTDVPADEWPGPDRTMSVSFGLGDEELVLLGGQTGELPIGDEHLAIDLASARAMECCHDSQWIVAVARLMVP
jgi:hypothetical protein